jgi:hypothetical protein
MMWNNKVKKCALTRAAEAGQKSLLYRHDKPKEPTKEGPFSYVFQDSPFASVSTIGRDHPMMETKNYGNSRFGGKWW